jgi:hypothetical protein
MTSNVGLKIAMGNADTAVEDSSGGPLGSRGIREGSFTLGSGQTDRVIFSGLATTGDEFRPGWQLATELPRPGRQMAELSSAAELEPAKRAVELLVAVLPHPGVSQAPVRVSR